MEGVKSIDSAFPDEPHAIRAPAAPLSRESRIGQACLEALIDRRSVPPRHLQAPGPDARELNRIVAAGLAAPCHGRLPQFSVIAIPPEDRSHLGEVFVAGLRESEPDPAAERIERLREKAMHAPTLLLLVCHVFPALPEIPREEQIASAGAALGAIVTAADLLGYGAMAVSGQHIRSKAFREAFRLARHDLPLAFIAIGTPSRRRNASNARRAPAEVLTTWRPDMTGSF